MQAWRKPKIISAPLSCSVGEPELRVAYQIHDLAASRRRRPADPGGKPARGAPSPGRLRATCRGLCSSWRCVSSAERHPLSSVYSKKNKGLVAFNMREWHYFSWLYFSLRWLTFQLKPAELRMTHVLVFFIIIAGISNFYTVSLIKKDNNMIKHK